MKKIAIIGANNFQYPLVQKANELGYETHVFAWDSDAIAKDIASKFYDVSITEHEQIYRKCKEIGVCAITTIASDLANITVNYVANKLGFPVNTNETLSWTTNKYLMKQRMLEFNIPCANFVLIENEKDIKKVYNMNLTFPLIVKPTDRSGSRSINKVFNDQELINAIKLAKESSFENKALVESFIEGDEFSCEAISYNGQHQILTLTKKYTTGSPHFIEIGHLQPSMLSLKHETMAKNIILKLLDVLKIQYGATHTEFKITPEGEIKIIEIGSRMGGDYIGSHLVKFSTNYDFIKMVIDTACNINPFNEEDIRNDISFVRFIMNSSDNKLVNNFINKYPDLLQFKDIKELQLDCPVVDSSSRHGYAIFKAESMKKIKNKDFKQLFNLRREI